MSKNRLSDMKVLLEKLDEQGLPPSQAQILKKIGMKKTKGNYMFLREIGNKAGIKLPPLKKGPRGARTDKRERLIIGLKEIKEKGISHTSQKSILRYCKLSGNRDEYILLQEVAKEHNIILPPPHHYGTHIKKDEVVCVIKKTEKNKLIILQLNEVMYAMFNPTKLKEIVERANVTEEGLIGSLQTGRWRTSCGQANHTLTCSASISRDTPQFLHVGPQKT